MEPSPSSHTLNLFGVLSESKRIINSHSRHFLALSVLFLLPLSFSLIIYPTIQSILSQPNSIFNHPPHPHLYTSLLQRNSINLPIPAQTQLDKFTNNDRVTQYPLQLDSINKLDKVTNDKETQYPLELDLMPRRVNRYPLELDSIKSHALPTLVPVLYTLFAFVLFLSAIATITYSTFHGFYGRPVKIGATLNSLLSSFFPLCATLLVSQVIVCGVGFVFAFLGGLIYKGVELIGVDVSFDSRCFSLIGGFVVFMVCLCVIYLHVVWVLAPVVVVVESKFGYEPLRRSAELVRGMRSVALLLVVFFGVSIWVLTRAFSGSVVNVGGVWGWESMVFVFETVISSGLVTLIMLQSMAAIVVLYMYCKAVRGELTFEIAEEFASDYVSLPFDDEKVPHVVSVVYG